MAEEIKKTGETPAENKIHKLDPVDIAVQLSRPINKKAVRHTGNECKSQKE